MVKKLLIILGTGGHCRSIIDVVESTSKYQIMGLLDVSNPAKLDLGSEINGYEVLGTYSDIDKFRELDAEYVIAVGDNANRYRIVTELILKNDLKFATCIHKTAYVSSRAIIEPGTVVMANAVVNNNAKVGNHCIINTSSVVEHDCSIGDFATIAPRVVMGGTVTVGNHSVVSIGSSILHNISIGENTVIGAGALVNKSIPSNVVAFGLPCKIIKGRQFGDKYL